MTDIKTCGRAFPSTLSKGVSKLEYFMAHMDVPNNLSLGWGELMVGPCPKDENGQPLWNKDMIHWWAKVYATFRLVYARAMVEATEKL